MSALGIGILLGARGASLPSRPAYDAATRTASGRAPAGSTVKVLLNGTTAGTASANAQGRWSYAFAAAPTAGQAIAARVEVTSPPLAIAAAPAGGEATASMALPASVVNLAAFGDSYTFGVGATAAETRYMNIVAAALSGGLVLNRAVSGTVLQNSPDAGGAPMANNGRDRYAAALTGAASQRETVILAYGFNDARYVGAPTSFNVQQFETDYREILDGLLVAGYRRDRMILVTPWWISDAGLNLGSSGFSGQTRAGFEAFVEVVRTLAAQYDTYLADAYAAMRDGGGASLLDADGIHANDEGHAAIAACVLAARRKGTIPVGTTPWLHDTMTDPDGTLLTAHVGESGTSWTLQTGYTPAAPAQIAGNRMIAPSTLNVYRSQKAAPSADYDVEAVLHAAGSLAANDRGITARADAAANSFYFARFNGSGWQLFKTVAGTSTQLGATVAGSFSAGSQLLRLRVNGSMIQVYLNNGLIISATDTEITAPGFPGIRSTGTAQTATAGIHLDSIRAMPIGA